jgi:pyruvate/2-oxoglutarate/acetoin dehydrogenase E1 component
MPQKSIHQALNEALAQEMRRDPRVVAISEDVAGGAGSQGQRDAYGGALGVTKGLIGESRITDTPISESAIIGAAAGAAVTGLRPVAELMFCDFLGVCFDQILNQAAPPPPEALLRDVHVSC